MNRKARRKLRTPTHASSYQPFDDKTYAQLQAVQRRMSYGAKVARLVRDKTRNEV